MSADRKTYTVVHLARREDSADSVTRLTVSEELIRELIGGYGLSGYRVGRMGDVIVIRDYDSEPSPAPACTVTFKLPDSIEICRAARELLDIWNKNYNGFGPEDKMTRLISGTIHRLQDAIGDYRETSPSPSPSPERPMKMGQLSRAFEWLREYGLETDDLEEADHCKTLLERLSDLERMAKASRPLHDAGPLEHAVSNLLTCWLNGVETTTSMWEAVSNALEHYRKGGRK